MASRPYLQPMAELRRMQINVVKLKGTLKVPSAVAIRQLTTDHSLDPGVDLTEGGKTLEARERPTTTTLLT